MTTLVPRSFPRATAPFMPKLGETLLPLLYGQSPHLRYDRGSVIVEVATWAAVDLAAVQAAITAATEDTERERAKWKLTHLETATTALIDVLRDLINEERARHGIAAVSKAALLQLVLDKVDTL